MSTKNTVIATKKQTTKDGVKYVAPNKKAPKKVSALTESKKNLVNLWKEETLTPKAIYKYFVQIIRG